MYEEHPTVSQSLCDLWCQIKEFEGVQCRNTSVCPYIDYPVSGNLCDLWDEEKNCTGSGISSASVPYSSCPFLDGPDENLACKLWCDVQSECINMGCSGMPTCPYENLTTPYNDVACKLWAELNDAIQDSAQGSEEEYTTCIYLNSVQYSIELCDLWCQLNAIKNGKI